MFFASIKKWGKNEEDPAEMCNKNIYVSLRYELSKFIKKEMGFDIGDDPEVISSHEMFLANY